MSSSARYVGIGVPTTTYFERFNDGGSFVTVGGTNSSFRLNPTKNFSNQWLWFALRSKFMGGTTPTFLINKANRRGTPFTGANLAVWSTSVDTDTWNKFDNQSTGVTDIEFYNDDPFPSGTVYVSYLPMYPFSRVQRVLSQWIESSNARITNTPSSTNFVIGNSTARSSNDGSGRMVSSLPFYGFKLTNASGFTKNKMILTAGNHPDEVQGAYQLEGAMNWLLGGSAEAELLLNWFEIYVYPCLNPQGVWSGYFRSSPQTPGSDNNRIWDTTGTNEAVDAFKAAFTADTGGTIEVGIDFHGASFISYPAYMNVEDHTETLYAAFLTEMQALNPSFGYDEETITQSLSYLFRHTYSARFSTHCECMCLSATDFPAAWKTNGQHAMQAVSAMLSDGLWTNHP